VVEWSLLHFHLFHESIRNRETHVRQYMLLVGENTATAGRGKTGITHHASRLLGVLGVWELLWQNRDLVCVVYLKLR
jgi:hypothetical protein